MACGAGRLCFFKQSLPPAPPSAKGVLWSWGVNDLGQLGLGDTTNRSTPVQVNTPASWRQVAGKIVHSLGIAPDGKLYAWGQNAFGELGVGDRNSRSTPTQVGSLTWTDIGTGGSVSGFAHSIGISGEKLFAWGLNTSGQLGLGDLDSRSTPVQVGSASTWTMVRCGILNSFGISEGKLYAWGNNGPRYSLGLGDSSDRSTPTQVGAMSTWTLVAPDPSDLTMHSLGLADGGKAFAWGRNTSGQLGLGDTTDRSVPVQVGSMSWTTVSAGFGFSLGISDGKLYAWGSNDNGIGELGLGDTSPRSTPTQVGVATDWTVCSAGAEGTAAGISGGKLYTWGKNLYGQLGLGDIDARSTPTQVGVATTWQEIECSKGGMLGLLA